MTFEEAVKLMQKRKVVARRGTPAFALNKGYTVRDNEFVTCDQKGYGPPCAMSAVHALATDWEVVDCAPPSKFIDGWYDVAYKLPPLGVPVQAISATGSWDHCVERRTNGWYSWETGGYDQFTWIKIDTPVAWAEEPTLESITRA